MSGLSGVLTLVLQLLCLQGQILNANMAGGQDTQQMLNYIRDQLYTPIPTPDLIKDDVNSFHLVSPKPALWVPDLRNL